jgi:predicted ATPase
MINKVVIKNFKRFGEVTFEIPGHVVIAGPNNTGKTTMLQAVAAWNFAYKEWKTLNNSQLRNGYERKPIARQAFSSVPLRSYELLWKNRDYGSRTIEIEVNDDSGWSLAMEFIPNTTEQIFVRPKATVSSVVASNTNVDAVFIPAMTGLTKDEPFYSVQATIDALLGQARPGDVLRNLLVLAYQNTKAWDSLQESIKKLFNFELLPPDNRGAYILAEYRMDPAGKSFDIASAGSGFQQVLMLLTFLNTRKGSVILLDEPDAHLHIILQDAIYSELRAVAERENSQLIIATHSEVIINSVEPRDLCVLLDTPRRITSEQERAILSDSLRILSNTDIMLALDSPGILYIEGVTDLNILKEWAKILNHPLAKIFNSNKFFWKPIITEQRIKGSGIRSTDHHKSLCLVRPDYPALELVDGDANPGIVSSTITGKGYQRLRWNRYEIESYLLHPIALERFVQQASGSAANSPHVQDLQTYLKNNFPPQFFQDPFQDIAFLKNTKARTDLIPPALSAGGIPGFPYQRFNEIAAVMLPGEIHPEVKEKLDLIQRAFNL